jgi:hypothetical protein
MQCTAVHLLKTSWAPSNSWNFYTKYIVAVDLFRCHCRRYLYLRGIGLLQLCRVIQRSVNKADCCRCLLQWPGKNQTRGGSLQWNSDCWHQTGVGVVSVLQDSACNTHTTPNPTTRRTKNNTTNVVIQQNNRKLLMMDILMSETCWAHKKWNKIASDIKLVFYSSTDNFII